MASNLTTQVRGIAKVVTAVANGDLKQQLPVEAKGEIATLADTINSMIDTLATFADQVTTVAREVGIEGKLGGQARVPGAAGIWRDLTDNVNQLAANLTTQVRAIAEVATAVTKGDLTRSITVEAQGEVAALKDNINEMIRNLRDTTRKNTEQDWLKTNLAKFTRMLQGQRDLATVSQLILSELAPLVTAQHGVFYVVDSAGDEPDAQAARQLRLQGPQARRQRVPAGRGAGRPVRSRTAGSSLIGHVPPRLHPDQLRPGRGAAPEHRGAAGAVRGRGQGGDRAGLLRRVQRDPPHLPRAADREHRHRAQHHRRQHAHRGAAQAVARRSPRACRPSRRRSPRPTSGWSSRPARCSSPRSCSGSSRTSCSRPTTSWRRRPSCSPARRPRSSRRTARSSRPRWRWRRRPSSWRSPPSTSPSSWPTCRTSCARRSTAC